MSDLLDNSCGDCGSEIVRLCPCCDLGDADASRTRSGQDTLGPVIIDRPRRLSSRPPPLPNMGKPSGPPPMTAFAAKLLALNVKQLGPVDALDLTDIVTEDSEELGQDQINDLFGA